MVASKELNMTTTPFLDNMLKRQMIGLFFLTFIMMSYLYATQKALDPSIEWFESGKVKSIELVSFVGMDNFKF